MSAHLIGWRLSAGDEHLVFDASSNVIAAVTCGGLYRRSFDEATDMARLIVAAPDGLAVAVELCAIFDRHATETGVFEDADEMINDIERFGLHEKLTAFIAKSRGEVA